MEENIKKKRKNSNSWSNHFFKNFCCKMESSSPLSVNGDNQFHKIEYIKLPVLDTESVKPKKVKKTKAQISLQNQLYHPSTSSDKIRYPKPTSKENGNYVKRKNNYPVEPYKKDLLHKEVNTEIETQTKSKDSNSLNSRATSYINQDKHNFVEQRVPTNDLTGDSTDMNKMLKRKKKNYSSSEYYPVTSQEKYFSDISIKNVDDAKQASDDQKSKMRRKLWQDLVKILRKLFVSKDTKSSKLVDKTKKLKLINERNNEVLPSNKNKAEISSDKGMPSTSVIRHSSSLENDAWLQTNSSILKADLNMESDDFVDHMLGKYLKQQNPEENSKLDQQAAQEETKENKKVDDTKSKRSPKKKVKKHTNRKSRKNIDKIMNGDVIKNSNKNSDAKWKGKINEKEKNKAIETKESVRENANVYQSVSFKEYREPLQKITVSPIDPPQSYTIGSNILTINTKALPSAFKIKPKNLSTLNLRLKKQNTDDDQCLTKIDVFQISPNELLFPGQSIQDVVQPASEKDAKIILVSPDSENTSNLNYKSPITILPSKFDDDRENKILQKTLEYRSNKSPIVLPLQNQSGVRESKTPPTIVAIPPSEDSKNLTGTENKTMTIIISPSPNELRQRPILSGTIDTKWNDLVQDLGSSLPPSVSQQPMFIVVPEDSQYASKEITLDGPKGSINKTIVFVPSLEHLPQQQIISEELIEDFSNTKDQFPTLIILPSKSEHILINIDNNLSEQFSISSVMMNRPETNFETCAMSETDENYIQSRSEFRHASGKSPTTRRTLSNLIRAGKVKTSEIYNRFQKAPYKKQKMIKTNNQKSSKINTPYIVVHKPKCSRFDENRESKRLIIRCRSDKKLSIESEFGISRNEEQHDQQAFINTNQENQLSQTEGEISRKETKLSKSNTIGKISLKNKSKNHCRDKIEEQEESKKSEMKTYGQMLRERIDARFIKEQKKGGDDYCSIADTLMISMIKRRDKNL